MRHAPPISDAARRAGRPRWPAGLLTIAAVGGLAAWAVPAAATAAPAPRAAADSFAQTNLIASTKALHPKLVDPNLTNAWGLAAGAATPLWVSDNNSGKASVYGGGVKGSAVSLDLTVTVPGGNPTGQVFNSDASAFKVAGSPADFIVDSDSVGARQSPGEISAWNGGASFVVTDSPHGGPGGKTPAHAVFKGLALATTPKAGPELFAADVANAKVDVFNSKFHFVKTPKEFRDPKLPAGYTPFGIQELGGKIYVAYGKQNASKTDVTAGPGKGYVDVFTVNGVLVKHLIAGGKHSPLNAPWGLAIAPGKFGPFGGDLLVGNLGNGWINAFSATTGKFKGSLDTTKGKPIVIPGLWGLEVGNAAFGGASSLVFSAGPAGYKNGLVGILQPAKPAGGGGW